MKELERRLLNEFIERERLKGLAESTVEWKFRELEKYLLSLEGKPLLLACRDDVLRYLETSISEKQYNKRLGYLKGFSGFLLERGEILKDPVLTIPRLKEPEKVHLGVFIEEEVRRVINIIPGDLLGIRDRAMIELFYSAGLRLGELVGLDCDRVDFSSKEVFVRRGKGGKERIVPVGEKSLASLERYMVVRGNFLRPGREQDALFLSSRGRRIVPETVRWRIVKWKREAGVTVRGKAHAFRHSCASHMLKNGASIEMIKRLLGHELIGTTERYTHVFENDLKEIHRRSHPRGMEVE
jgi:site-specific recombinase XerD